MKLFNENGERLTDCCGAYATICMDDGTLCCRKCYEMVDAGQGDGTEFITLKGKPATQRVGRNTVIAVLYTNQGKLKLKVTENPNGELSYWYGNDGGTSHSLSNFQAKMDKPVWACEHRADTVQEVVDWVNSGVFRVTKVTTPPNQV